MRSNARFLIVAFVVSAVISLAWQFHAAQRGAVDSAVADQAAVSDEAGSELSAPQPRQPASQASARHSRVTGSGNADPTNKQRSEEESNAAVPTPEERYIYEYDEEWVGDLYTRLHSPDPLPIDEPDGLDEFTV